MTNPQDTVRFPCTALRFVDRGGGVEQEVCPCPLAFVHINKTAGTSFTQYLESHFTDVRAIAPPFLGDCEAMGIHDPDKWLFWGHVPLWQLDQHRRDLWHITFLRDPIRRIISQYRSHHDPQNLKSNWSAVLPAYAREALAFAQQATFEEYVFSDNAFLLGHIRDLQTHFLSSHRDPDHPDFLSSAISNLRQRILFFGMVERFDDSIALFQFQFRSSRAYLNMPQRRNASQPYPVSVSQGCRERLEALTRNDRALYLAAQQEFQRRLLHVRERAA